jgi:hypothetical protein
MIYHYVFERRLHFLLPILPSSLHSSSIFQCHIQSFLPFSAAGTLFEHFPGYHHP